MKHMKKVTVVQANALEGMEGWFKDNATAVIASVVSLVGGAGLGAFVKGQSSTSS